MPSRPDTCKFARCDKAPVFQSKNCWDHIEDKQEYLEHLEKLVKDSVSLQGANLSGVNLANFNMPRARLARANLHRANLSSCNLFDADLNNADLLGANLSHSDLTGANLNTSDLTRCSLNGARLWHADMENANLIEADLSSCDLWNTALSRARFWRTDFTGALSLSMKNFSPRSGKYFAFCRINEKGAQSAEEAYRDLKKYFLATGKYNDASWASYREKTMERRLLKKKKNIIAYLPSLIMNLLSGYGEKPLRIISSSFVVILAYSAAYALMDAVRFVSQPGYALSLGDYIYYSAVTFTTVGYGDFIPKSELSFRFLAASEAFIGAFMIGLFIFTLARRYSAR